MRILLTGANGYIGKRLLPLLLQQGHEVSALTRLGKISPQPPHKGVLNIVEGDLREPDLFERLTGPFDAAYYLVHSMAEGNDDFASEERRVAYSFIDVVRKSGVKQIIYLSGISNDSDLSPHLSSRRQVEDILGESGIPLTVLRASIIIGSGSASFEIVRDLVEKLPLMVAPRWIDKHCQPIAVYDALFYLSSVVGDERFMHKTFDIGGPEVMTFKEMMLSVAKVRGLKRYILSLPVLTPRLSSLWLYFVCSTNFQLARHLVDSMINETVCSDDAIKILLPNKLLSFEEAVTRAYARIADNNVVSSWKDAWNSNLSGKGTLRAFVEPPKHGCLKDSRELPLQASEDIVLNRIWSLGGNQGWLFMNWAWSVRGWIDKICGGVGLRRGRRHPNQLVEGESLDFWRVLVADRENKRLLLYAEMKLPGEAWLEFKIKHKDGIPYLQQTATFRPCGLLGRLYWYGLYPFHCLIFSGMARALTKE